MLKLGPYYCEKAVKYVVFIPFRQIITGFSKRSLREYSNAKVLLATTMHTALFITKQNKYANVNLFSILIWAWCPITSFQNEQLLKHKVENSPIKILIFTEVSECNTHILHSVCTYAGIRSKRGSNGVLVKLNRAPDLKLQPDLNLDTLSTNSSFQTSKQITKSNHTYQKFKKIQINETEQ